MYIGQFYIMTSLVFCFAFLSSLFCNTWSDTKLIVKYVFYITPAQLEWEKWEAEIHSDITVNNLTGGVNEGKRWEMEACQTYVITQQNGILIWTIAFLAP